MKNLMDLYNKRKLLESKIIDLNDDLEYYKKERKMLEKFKKIIYNFSRNYPKDVLEHKASFELYRRISDLLDKINESIDHHVSAIMLYRESLIEELRKVEEQIRELSKQEVK